MSPEDLDLDYYTGEIVDLESILREQIILMLPLKPLCDEALQGPVPLLRRQSRSQNLQLPDRSR